MKYEITIRQLDPFTKEEEERRGGRNGNGIGIYPGSQFSDRGFHDIRVVYAELTPEEFQAVKKAIIGVM